MRRVWTAAPGVLVLAGVLCSAVVATGITVAPAAAAPEGPSPRPDRVLIISLPGLTWEDIDSHDVPNLRSLLDDSAVADLATRTISRRTEPPDGYVTLGAGTRAIGAGTRIDGEAFEVDEPIEGDTAGQVFARRTGRDARAGLVHLGLPEILEANESERYDADIGALGDTLDDAGYSRAVIANADGLDVDIVTRDLGYYRRAAVAGLMGSDGTVPRGTTGPALLVEDDAAPFGLRYNNETVAAAFRDVWEPRSVVLVEASDLLRSDLYRPFADERERPPLFRQALRWTDDLVGQLLEEVDLSRDLVLVVGPSHPLGAVRLTIFGLHEPGGDPGFVRSTSTQRSGFVPLVDVAPTILDRLDLDRPTSMEGRAVKAGATRGSAADRRETLADWDEQSRFRDHQVGPVATVFVIALLLLAGATILCLAWRGSSRLRSVVFGGSLAVLGAIPAVYLARLLPFHEIGQVPYLAFIVVGGCVLAVAYTAVGRGRPLDAVIAALGAIVVVLVVDVLLRAPLQFNSALGYSPKVAGRFTGLGNLGFAALAAASLLLAALLTHRISGRRGARTAVALLAVVFVVAGTPFWGSDVGATLSMLPAFGVTATLLLGARVRISSVVKLALAAVVALVLFAAIDLARAADDRTHLGRLVERIGDEGWSSLADVVLRRGDQSLSLGGSVWVWVFAIAIGLGTILLWRAPGANRRVYERVPELRAAAIGLSVVGVIGFVVNDSGIAVPGVMLAVFTATMMGLLVRPPDAPDDAPSPPAARLPEPEPADRAAGGREEVGAAR